MATKEEISMVGFEIVAYAGDAQTDLLAALDAAREGDFEKAEQLHKDASDALIGAHDTQTKLLSQEAARLTSPHNQVPFQKLCRKLATGLFLFTRHLGTFLICRQLGTLLPCI